MICFGLWPQLNELSIFEKELFTFTAGKGLNELTAAYNMISAELPIQYYFIFLLDVYEHCAV